jgi:protein-S-isoprenylcysteine O-methyltransferase Ste14
MSGFRYWYGVVVIAFGGGALLYWFSIHPFVAFWRRVGVRTALAVNWSAVLILAAIVLWQHGRVMFGDLGTHWATIALGVVVLVASGVLRRRHAQAFGTAQLVGLPELDPARPDSRLVTDGIYARVRHPRYVQIWLGLLGHALIVNYVSTYALVAIATAVILLVVRMEERELSARFGDAYRDYAARVPRFLPHR